MKISFDSMTEEEILTHKGLLLMGDPLTVLIEDTRLEAIKAGGPPIDYFYEYCEEYYKKKSWVGPHIQTEDVNLIRYGELRVPEELRRKILELLRKKGFLNDYSFPLLPSIPARCPQEYKLWEDHIRTYWGKMFIESTPINKGFTIQDYMADGFKF